MTTTYDTTNIQGKADYTFSLITRGTPLDERECGYVGESLTDIRVRDESLRRIVEMHSTDLDTVDLVIARMREVALWAPSPEFYAPVTTMAAIIMWLNSGGDLDSPYFDIACDLIHMALGEDPNYSLALIIHDALDMGLPSDAWVRGISTITRNECLGLAGE